MDLYLEWNGDLVLTPNGSAQTAVNWDQARERIIRSFLTNSAQQLPDGSYTPADYVFDITFGEGAGALVDQNPEQAYILGLTQRMRQAVLSDASADPGQVPVIVITQPEPDTYQVFVSVPLIDGTQGSVSITLG